MRLRGYQGFSRGALGKSRVRRPHFCREGRAAPWPCERRRGEGLGQGHEMPTLMGWRREPGWSSLATTTGAVSKEMCWRTSWRPVMTGRREKARCLRATWWRFKTATMTTGLRRPMGHTPWRGWYLCTSVVVLRPAVGMPPCIGT